MKTDEVWITKSGEKIFVADMTESHAKNALRCMLRNRRKKLRESMGDLTGVGTYDAGEFYK